MLRPSADDGRCAVDITHKERSVSDVSTGGELSQAAFLVLRQCVIGDMQQGGVAADLGELDCPKHRWKRVCLGCLERTALI